VQQIGRELGVRYVVEGSVRKAVTRVRIVAQLIETETGANIWGDRYVAASLAQLGRLDEAQAEIAAIIRSARRIGRPPPSGLSPLRVVDRCGPRICPGNRRWHHVTRL
jgi:adenylate cyclase